MPKNSNEFMDFETRDFQTALRQYAKERVERDYDYIVNRAALNLAIKASLATPLAVVAKIRAIAKKPWWPKYVAKRLRGKGGVTVKFKKTRKVAARKLRLSFGRVREDGSHRRYTVHEARAASKALIDMRVKRKGYIRSGFGPIIDKLKLKKLGLRLSGAKRGTTKIRKKPGKVIVALPSLNPQCLLFGGKAASKIMKEGIRKAMPLAAADMREFVRQRMLKRAKKFAPMSK